jgi:hypothetical protein
MTDEAKPDRPERPKVLKRTDNWAEDQQERGYYYDDACGYETYDPEADEEEGEVEEHDPST